MCTIAQTYAYLQGDNWRTSTGVRSHRPPTGRKTGVGSLRVWPYLEAVNEGQDGRRFTTPEGAVGEHPFMCWLH